MRTPGLAAGELGLASMLQSPLGEATDDETEEQKRKRLELKSMQAQAGMSPAASALFSGGYTGRGGFGSRAF